MTAMQHVYVTAHGSWQSGPWVGESAQIGLRIVPILASALPDKGTEFVVPMSGDVVADQGNTAGTHGTLMRLWKCRMGGLGSTEDYNDALSVDVAEDVWTFLDATKGLVSNKFTWTHVKQAAVSADGKTIKGSSIYTFTTGIAGTVSTWCLPPQLAAAVTMRAPIAGRRGRGRIYFPGSAMQTTVDGTLPAADATSLRAELKNLLDNLAELPGTSDFNLVTVVTGAGQATAVRPSQIRTGNRWDTMQSRRRQVPESYATLDL